MTTLLASLLAVALLALVIGAVPARGDRCDLCWRRAYARLDHIRGEPAERSVPTGTGQIVTNRSIQCCRRHLDAATRHIQEALLEQGVIAACEELQYVRGFHTQRTMERPAGRDVGC